MLNALLAFLVVTSGVIVAYHHIGFPLLLKWMARRRDPNKVTQPALDNEQLPTIRLIVPAHNEASVIAAKIQNLLALFYPSDRLSIVIALDGCTDDTRTIVMSALSRAPQNATISVVEYARNVGKIAVLNDQISKSSAEIIVLSDASAALPADALLKAARHFSDGQIGVVCGTYQLKEAGSEGERQYWRYQTQIKADEATIAAPMGAHGAFYLFRRMGWSPLPADTINDDFILPMRIVASGARAVYDRSIVATELERTRPQQEYGRRIRIGAGNMQQLVRLPELFSLKNLPLAFVYGSGKGLRPLIPFVALIGALSLVLLALRGEWFAQILTALMLMTIGAVALVLSNRDQTYPRPLLWLTYLVEGHTASLIGAIQFLRGDRLSAWQPSAAAPQAEDGYLSRGVELSKRVFDLVVACGVFVVFLIVLPFVALAIKLDSPGPIFYRQLRVGRTTPTKTELFYLIKFRSMRTDAEAGGKAKWATKNDSRVTRVGRFLRDSRLDELPQCINVFRGEMSVIGPRPERPQIVTELNRQIPFYVERTAGIKPGITGLAQVHLPYDADIEDVRMKCVYDHAYAMRISTWRAWLKTDLEICWKTFTVMVGLKGQ